ncbi:MAG: DUF1905 domain-containing protein [Phenylobacterium sp.]|uniref:DUF1905 domain-containing protein n=1 Tax=Phenylobacterium sp. TaxID=1871053 RepID=UPI001A5F48B3|nr:DUF1905 domain-containing protein [Phenylobacterium sp.]MBL8773685.1 DUF1905 domain-containing protein [Phenylobacterium sp.]
MKPDLPAHASIAFEAEVIHWRGPSPFFFAVVPRDLADDMRAAARLASYGWGVVPVSAMLDGVTFTTSLFPRDGTYLVPLKDAVRRKVGVTAGDRIEIQLSIAPRRP